MLMWFLQQKCMYPHFCHHVSLILSHYDYEQKQTWIMSGHNVSRPHGWKGIRSSQIYDFLVAKQKRGWRREGGTQCYRGQYLIHPRMWCSLYIHFSEAEEWGCLQFCWSAWYKNSAYIQLLESTCTLVCPSVRYVWAAKTVQCGSS